MYKNSLKIIECYVILVILWYDFAFGQLFIVKK